ncbi:MAG TPA: hypothetical protein VLA61_14405 [Ideonella sp.]|nr:hypothetical protein [Ideonella sp.]HSI49463.1 hypothetical protein [Ideonella sp.]
MNRCAPPHCWWRSHDSLEFERWAGRDFGTPLRASGTRPAAAA